MTNGKYDYLDLQDMAALQRGEKTKKEKLEITKLQKEACGYMTSEEKRAAQMKAIYVV